MAQLPSYYFQGVNPTASSGASGLLAMPTFDYNYAVAAPTNPRGSTPLTAATVAGDYYSRMASDYLPTVDQFASSNAGRMVDLNGSTFMDIADFAGTGSGGRAKLLGKNIQRDFIVGDQRFSTADMYENYRPNPYNPDWTPGAGKYYYRDARGNIVNYTPNVGNIDQNGYDTSGVPDGVELLTRRDATDDEIRQRLRERGMSDREIERYIQSRNAVGLDIDQYSGIDPSVRDSYDTFGTVRQETQQEAVDRLLGEGGSRNAGNFLSGSTLDRTTKQDNEKYGRDFVNIPELQQHIDDPSWVTKDNSGNITAIRAELVPYVMRQALGDEFANINRGMTDESDVLGTLVGTIVIGVMTAGIGSAFAAGMGMTTAVGAGGAALTGAAGVEALAAGASLTAGGMATAGAIGGGLSTALQGGSGSDILRGAALGGLGGAASGYVSNGVQSTLGGVSDTFNAASTAADGSRVAAGLGNQMLTRGITSGAGAAIQGRDPVNAAITAAASAAVAYGLTDDNGRYSDNRLVNDVTGNLVNTLVGGTVSQYLDDGSPSGGSSSGSTGTSSGSTSAPSSSSNTPFTSSAYLPRRAKFSNLRAGYSAPRI